MKTLSDKMADASLDIMMKKESDGKLPTVSAYELASYMGYTRQSYYDYAYRFLTVISLAFEIADKPPLPEHHHINFKLRSGRYQ
jgi:hypothetical protein